MGARVINLAEIRASRSAPKHVLPLAAQAVGQATPSCHFWTGASGRRYVHTVYTLFDCPEVPSGNFMLVHRDTRGRRSVLAIGDLRHSAASLNLAELRQRGARLGANEVHIHLLAETAHERRLIEVDLRAGCETIGGDERLAGPHH